MIYEVITQTFVTLGFLPKGHNPQSTRNIFHDSNCVDTKLEAPAVSRSKSVPVRPVLVMLVAGFSPFRPEFFAGAVKVRFVTVRVTLGQVLDRVL